MAKKLDVREVGADCSEEGFENALVLDETTATYAAAFAEVCSALGSRESRAGDPYVALRLAQQMKQAADAFFTGEIVDSAVWVPKDATEH